MKHFFSSILLVIFFALSSYCYEILFIEPKYTLIAMIINLIILSVYFIIAIKPNFMKFKNYLLAMVILFYMVGFFILSGFYTYESIRDLQGIETQNATVCGRLLDKNIKWHTGSEVLEYEYTFCNEEGKIVNSKVFPESDDIVKTIPLYANVSYTFMQGSKDILVIQSNNYSKTIDYDYWYFVFLPLLSFIFLISINQKNIKKIVERELTAEEEYVLYLLGKKKKEKPKTLVEKVKEKFFKKTEDEDEDKNDEGESLF